MLLPFLTRLGVCCFLVLFSLSSLQTKTRTCKDIFPDGFVFVKTPKTASTALKVFFLGVLKKYECRDWYLICEKNCQGQPKIINTYNPEPEKKYNFLLNHVVNSKPLIASYMKSPHHLWFSSLRHPLDHVISSFFHFGVETLDLAETLFNGTFTDEKKEKMIYYFSDYITTLDNEQFRVIKGDNKMDNDFFIKQVFDFYDFIFVNERLEQDQKRFENKYGVVGSIPTRVVNSYPEHIQTLKDYLLSREIKFEEDPHWNLDLKLYNHVLKTNEAFDFEANDTSVELTLPPERDPWRNSLRLRRIIRDKRPISLDDLRFGHLHQNPEDEETDYRE